MAVDFDKLKQLREETGYSFSLVKKVLEECDNNMQKARVKLKKEAGELAAKKSDKSTSQGGIFSYVHHNRKVAALLELLSETDFVSGNDEFKTLGQELAMQAASVPSENVEEFLSQEYIREPGKTVQDLVQEAITKFGENIKVGRIIRWVIV